MEKQRKSLNFLLKRRQLPNEASDERFEDHDASLQSRLGSCVAFASRHLKWSVVTVHHLICRWHTVAKHQPLDLCVFSSDTKMDRKDKLFVINEVGLLDLTPWHVKEQMSWFESSNCLLNVPTGVWNKKLQQMSVFWGKEEAGSLHVVSISHFLYYARLSTWFCWID